jgi:pimeloyl-ACP methyl ester carboxylesterase
MIKRFLISIIAFSIVTVFLLWLTGNLSKVGAFLLTSRIEVDFDKGGNRFVKEVAPYPKEVIDNKEVTIYQTPEGIEYVRTPDTRFENLSGYDFSPNYVEINGLRMHYIDEGPRDGEVILMLHGQPTWAYLYRKMIKGLVQQGYRCIAPDMIGMGRSDKPIRESFHTYDKHCEITMAFIDSLELNDITIFGQDWGSVIEMRIVGDNPELFARVVLANGDLPRIDQESNPFYIPSPLTIDPALKFPNDLLKHGLKGMPDAFQGWILFALQNPNNYYGNLIQRMTSSDLTAEEIAAYKAPFPSFIYRTGPRMLPSMIAGVTGQQLPAWENLQKFEKPFISFIGLQDRMFGSPELQEEWINAVPGAQGQDHDQFYNANHFIQEDIGQILAERVHQFILKNPI